jgi:SAM-dependent methyltransferase
MSDRKVDFDEFAADYSKLLGDQTRFFSPDEAYFARYKAQIARDQVGVEPRRVLEFGCGIGRNIPHLREAFPSAEVVGSDVSGRSLQIARQDNPGVAFHVEGADELDRGPQFDMIFVAGVFHHIRVDERSSVAERLYARLNPGGSLMVFEHNPYNPVTRRIVSNCPYDEDAVLLAPRELRRLLERASFAVKDFGFALFFPPSWKRLHTLEKYLARVPVGGQYWVHARLR